MAYRPSITKRLHNTYASQVQKNLDDLNSGDSSRVVFRMTVMRMAEDTMEKTKKSIWNKIKQRLLFLL